MKILKIGAIWCPECLIMRPRWLAIEKEFPGLEMPEVDVDQQPDIKKKHQVDHIPTYIFFGQNGEEIFRLKGLVEIDDLKAKILPLKDQ